ncbi:hypothetical protein [Maribellus sp. YY47]|uniref:hypothetical protein n=1 Tax=Maribellus sp. YY47 TaxID=2929486 RepID=UPI002000897A|nr:hypothetical protein [Maribellus sp. YY47]MCK3684032.1 hypothetical protein [Maribellus sp. YY47]
MKKIASLLLVSILFCWSCKSPKSVIEVAPTKPPVVTSEITYSYSADQIRYGKNNFKRAWANKNNVQLLHLSILNNADDAIHGSQLGFYSDGNKLEMVNNRLAAEKLGTRRFPKAAYVIPVAIVFYVAWEVILEMVGVNDDLDGDGFSDYPDFPQNKEEKAPTEKMNFVQRELYLFNIASEIIYPHKKVEGFVAFRSKKPITELTIKLEDTDYKVVQ